LIDSLSLIGEPNYLLNQGSADEPYDHGKDTQEFYKVTHDFDEALKVDNLQTSQYQVQMVSKVGFCLRI